MNLQTSEKWTPNMFSGGSLPAYANINKLPGTAYTVLCGNGHILFQYSSLFILVSWGNGRDTSFSVTFREKMHDTAILGAIL